MNERRWFGLCVAGLALYDAARSAWLPDGWDLPANIAAAAAVTASRAGARLSAAELGLARSAAVAGLRWGGAAWAAVAVPVAVAAAVAPSWFETDRAAVSGARLAGDVLFVIPVGTVLVEELIFRGVLTGLGGRFLSPRRTLFVVAGLFGLWHVPGAWKGSVDDGWRPAAFAAAGAVAATFAAGLVFGWLRQRSQSLIAPSLAHLATNTVPYAAAWLVAR